MSDPTPTTSREDEAMTTATVKVNTEGLTAHPARPAARMPVVQGKCPCCGLRSLFLASGGHVTCASLSCPNPLLACEALGDG